MKNVILTDQFQYIYPKIKGRIVNATGHLIHLEFRVFKKPWFLGFMRKPRWYSYEYAIPPIFMMPITIFVNKKPITFGITFQ